MLHMNVNAIVQQTGTIWEFTLELYQSAVLF